MPQRVLVLDIGGVVLDVDLDAGRAELQRRWALPAEAHDALLYHSGVKAAMELGALSEVHAVQRVLAALTNDWAASGTPQDVHAIMNAALHQRPAVSAWLAALVSAGQRVVVLSNIDPIHAAWTRANVGFAPEAWVMSCEIGALKPHAAAFEAALVRANVGPDQAVLLDDRADNVAAALSLGLHAVRYETLPQAQAALAALGVAAPPWQ